MNTSVQNLPVGSINTKPFWAAISVLGVAVVALGASLIHVQTRPVDGHAAFAQMDSAAMFDLDSQSGADSRLPVATVAADEAVVPAKAAQKPGTSPIGEVAKPTTPLVRATTTPARPAVAPADPAAPRVGANGRTAPAGAGATTAQEPAHSTYRGQDAVPMATQGVVMAPPAVCATCGRVESVTPIPRAGHTQGVGAVAGGVLGAVVGNQIGKGSGRTVATILGAVGGGVAGNAVEKNMSTSTVYQVRVRMDDGSLRTIERPSAPAIGSAVTLDGQLVRSPDSGMVTAGENRRPQPMAPPQARVYTSERN